VRLLRGDYAQATVYSHDPVAVARDFADAGAALLHVVDLDEARGSGSNRALIETLARSAPVEVAGGVRSLAAARAWIDAGAERVVLGSLVVDDAAAARALVDALPGQVVVALDARAGEIHSGGWMRASGLSTGEALMALQDWPIAAVELTAIERDGSLEGPDLGALAAAVGVTAHPVIASGGISSLDDLHAVAAAGATGAILGRALYEGRITVGDALRAMNG
jgi:phosphoribosylformimino-5-aminoimidazole carboxamide ribotide isomerase